MDAIKEVGCLLCLRNGIGWVLPEIHHLLSGGRRRGHAETIGLCPWHHRGVVPHGSRKSEMENLHGPALWYGSKPFAAHWGSDDELLAEQNRNLNSTITFRDVA